MLRRIISGLGANAFGQAITIAIQLVSLPLFLLFWDTSTYGSWLILSAVPAYLSMADLGMVSAAGNKMTMALGRSDAAEANRIFQSAQLFMMIVCGSLALLVTPIALFGPLPWSVSFDERGALAALFLSVILALFGGLAEAVFRATGRYATGTMLGNLTRLGEWGGYLLGLFLFRNFAGVAICGFLARAGGTCLGMLLAQRGEHSLQWGMRQASKTEIMKMAGPAISFMAFPLANALSLQGITLLTGALLGAATVAVFNTCRTIARVAMQLNTMLSHALWPEFARLYGEGGARAVETLFRRSAALGVLQSAGLSLLLYFVSPWLLQVWTHGLIGFDRGLMMLLLTYAAVCGAWHVPCVLLMATNQHVGLARWSLAQGGLSVALAWVLGTAWQIHGIAAAMLLSEVFIAVVCGYLTHRAFLSGPSVKGYAQ